MGLVFATLVGGLLTLLIVNRATSAGSGGGKALPPAQQGGSSPAAGSLQVAAGTLIGALYARGGQVSDVTTDPLARQAVIAYEQIAGLNPDGWYGDGVYASVKANSPPGVPVPASWGAPPLAPS